MSNYLRSKKEIVRFRLFSGKTNLVFIAIFILLSGFSLVAKADIHWVSADGKATWANGKSKTPLSGTAACSLTTANGNAAAGDTIYMRGGDYNTYIVPPRSGTALNRIIYKNYGSEIVTIRDASYGILLDGKSYITVQGINFYNLDRFMYLQNRSNYNIIAYCKFDLGRHNNWTGSTINKSSSYNWIHHCSFSNYGGCIGTYASGSDQGTNLDIGDEESATDASQYNVIEESTFYHAGHHLLGVFSKYNTIRNNYFHNEAWSNGRGHRNLYLQGVNTNSGYSLLEGNRFGYSSRSCNNQILTPASVSFTTSDNIFRYNKIYHSIAAGISMASYANQGPYSTGSYNEIYNNTIFNSGYNIDPSYKGTVEDASIFFSNSINTGNQFRNNLYFAHFQPYGGSPKAKQIYANNWDGDAQGDPKFVNASLIPPTDKSDATLPNLDLQSTSPAIDKGGELTTVTSATGSGTSLTVAKADYFQDGTWGPPGIIQADWIAVGTVDNAVQILSISGNTINLASSINWTNGASVWLYKKSDGVRVLYGSAPDAGAFEYNSIPTGQNAIENTMPTLNIYPNPFSKSTTIDFSDIKRSNNDILCFHLYDLLGKEVTVFNNISADKIILEKRNAAKGLYIYKVMLNKKYIGSGKLSIQ